jgi:peptide/nickel transport system permease protein
MITYIARRVATGLILAVLVTMLTFLLLSFSFENVVISLLGGAATPENVTALTRELGYDRPVMVQYFDWLFKGLTGDFGNSLFTSQSVVTAVISRLAVTLSLIVVALTITAVISVLLGVWSASKGGIVDKIAQGISLIGYIFPGLLIAIALVVIFAVNLKWLPATGYTPLAEDPVKWLRSITIPVIVLVIAGAANLAAQVRGTMIDELRKDYVRTLRTRGINPRSIVLKHALRNAAGPGLTVLSLEFISMFGAALIIEKVFALPGFGTFAFNASLTGDIPVIMGITVFSVALVISVNLLVDLANGWLNPKARVF